MVKKGENFIHVVSEWPLTLNSIFFYDLSIPKFLDLFTIDQNFTEKNVVRKDIKSDEEGEKCCFLTYCGLVLTLFITLLL